MRSPAPATPEGILSRSRCSAPEEKSTTSVTSACDTPACEGVLDASAAALDGVGGVMSASAWRGESASMLLLREGRLRTGALRDGEGSEARDLLCMARSCASRIATGGWECAEIGGMDGEDEGGARSASVSASADAVAVSAASGDGGIGDADRPRRGVPTCGDGASAAT